MACEALECVDITVEELQPSPCEDSATFTVAVTDSQPSSCEDSATFTVVVTDPTGCTVTAVASASITSGVAPVTVNFTGNASIANGSAITGWFWDFGDGSFATTQNASHTYSTPGNYNATLTATGDNGACTDTVLIPIFVSDPNSGNDFGFGGMMSKNIRPFGLREVQIISECGRYKAMLCPQSMSFTPEYSNNELKCGDKIAETSACLEKVSFDLEAAGISFEAYAIATGNAETFFTAPDGSAARSMLGKTRCLPYVCLVGKSIGSEGRDDVWIKLPRVKVTGGPTGTFSQDEFFVSSFSGTATADENGCVWEIVHHDCEQPLNCTCLPESWQAITALQASCFSSDCAGGTLSVDEWPNFGYGDHVTQTVVASQPTFLQSDGNGNPCVNFDGVDDYLQAPFDPNAGQWTWGASFSPTTVTGEHTVWALASNFRLRILNGQIELNNGATTLLTGPAAVAGEVYATAVRYDGSNVELWVNGTYYGSVAAAPIIGTDTTREIGSLVPGVNNFFAGCLYQLQVMNAALSTEDVEALVAGMQAACA